MTREEANYEIDRMITWSKDLSDEEIEALVIARDQLSNKGGSMNIQFIIHKMDEFEKAIEKRESGNNTDTDIKDYIALCHNAFVKREELIIAIMDNIK